MSVTYALAVVAIAALVIPPTYSSAAGYDAHPISEAQFHDGIQWLTPLPHQIEVSSKAQVPVSSIRIRLPREPTELDRCAAEELAQLLNEATGIQPRISSLPGPPGTFVIDLRRSPTDTEAIGDRPNADQAYLIRTVRDKHQGVVGLACGANTDVGTYYAVKTLKQLLAPGIEGRGEAATVAIPVCEITDWPDMEERGQWGGITPDYTELMAELKFNLVEQHAVLSVNEEGVGHAKMDMQVMEHARHHAVRIVPIIHHLEQLELFAPDIFNIYPQLKAVGADNNICFSRPEAVRLLTQWLTELGKIPGVGDVMIWLSEEGATGCQCEQCQQQDRFILETRTCLAAWEQAKKECPHLGLRLLLTQASHPSNDKILAAVPPEVKVSYYHGSLTYDTTRRHMIYPLLEEYVKQGHWLGVYPTVGACWLIAGPFTNPQFIHYRMTEFVDKGLSCLVAYASPSSSYYIPNIEAAMEWAWNAHGRSPAEFAASYAVRHGLQPPKKFAEWTETISPISWDIYGSRFPYREIWGGTEQVILGNAKLGTGIFGEFKREEQFDEDLAKCPAALALAQEIGNQGIILETRIIQAYTQVLKSTWELSKLVQGDHGVSQADREAAQEWFDLFTAGCDTLVTLYPEWSDTTAPQLAGNEPPRFWATVDAMDRLAGRVAAVLEESGIEDKAKAFRVHIIGEWRTEQFTEQPEQVQHLDVTQWIDGPGTYTVRPKWHSGSLGLAISRMALVSCPQGNTDQFREEATDEHDCHAGAWVKGDVYTLQLTNYERERNYAVVAHIRGGDTTNGEFEFRKLRPDNH